jgi:hypothetical protein
MLSDFLTGDNLIIKVIGLEFVTLSFQARRFCREVIEHGQHRIAIGKGLSCLHLPYKCIITCQELSFHFKVE